MSTPLKSRTRIRILAPSCILSSWLLVAGPVTGQSTALGNELVVNQDTANCAGAPRVLPRDDGGFVVVWRDSTSQDILGRVYDADANGSAEVTLQTGADSFNDAAGSITGDFVVVWTQYPAPGSDFTVWASRFTSAGTKVGTEFAVSAATASGTKGTVAVEDSGDFVVAWVEGPYGSDAVQGRRYASDGSAVGSQFAVSTSGSGIDYPAIGIDPDSGEFVVVWGAIGNYRDVFARRFDAGGSPLDDQVIVNTYTTSNQSDPAVAVAADGSFFITWSGRRNGSASNVSMTSYNSAGQQGEERHLGGPADEQTGPAIAVSRDGGSFVVPYEQVESAPPPEEFPTDIRGTFIATDGQVISADSVIVEGRPAVAVDEMERATLVWYDETQNVFCAKIVGRRYQLWQTLDMTRDATVHSRIVQSGWKYFVHVPSTTGDVVVRLANLPAAPPNDADLFVSATTFPTLASWDCFSALASSQTETCVVSGVAGVPIYVGVNGFSVGSVDFTVTASPPQVFTDGFESGNTSAWSATLP